MAEEEKSQTGGDGSGDPSSAKSILKEIAQWTGQTAGGQDVLNQSLIEHLQKANEESTQSWDNVATKVKQLAEEEADAIVEQEKANDERAKNDSAEALKNRTTLGLVADSFKGGFGEVKDSMKEDFQLLTLTFSKLGSTPFIRTIIKLLAFLGLWIFKLAMDIIGSKWFPGLLTRDKNNTVMLKDTFKNIGKFFGGKLGFGPKIDKTTGKESTPAEMAKAKAIKKWDKGTVRDEKGQFAEKGGEHDSLMNQTKKWINASTRSFDKINKNFSDIVSGNTKWGEKLGELKSKIWTGVKKYTGMTKMAELMNTAASAISGALRKVGNILLKQAKKILAPMIGFVIAATLWVFGIISTVVSLLVGAIASLIVPIMIGLLIIGLIWLGKTIIENWDRIKEKFAIAMEQLSIWASKAALWLSTALAPLRDKLGMFFAVILDGIAAMLNGAIEWINSMQPNWLRKITGGDIITWRMEEGHVEAASTEAALRQSERDASGVEIEEREAALADRKAAYDAEYGITRAPKVQQNNMSQNFANTRMVHNPDTAPYDRHAAASATAQ